MCSHFPIIWPIWLRAFPIIWPIRLRVFPIIWPIWLWALSLTFGKGKSTEALRIQQGSRMLSVQIEPLQSQLECNSRRLRLSVCCDDPTRSTIAKGLAKLSLSIETL